MEMFRMPVIVYSRLLHPKLKRVACVHPGQHKKTEDESVLTLITLIYLKIIGLDRAK